MGPVEGGGTFDIETNTDTELIVLGSLGAIQRLGENWSIRYTATAELHDADWKVRDRMSGNTGSISDYNIYGIRVGMTYRFEQASARCRFTRSRI